MPRSRHRPIPRPSFAALLCAVLVSTAAGCGTTRWSDSKRTATEQLLISDAVERAVMQIDMRPLAGQTVFLDTKILDDVSDGKYLASALKHQLLASGCRVAAAQDAAKLTAESAKSSEALTETDDDGRTDVVDKDVGLGENMGLKVG